MNEPIQYDLRLLETEAGIGYFSAIPKDGNDGEPDYVTGLAYLREHPNDAFMRRHLLTIIGRWPMADILERFERIPADDALQVALFLEVGVVGDFLEEMRERPASQRSGKLLTREQLATTPLIYLKSEADEDRDLQRRWIDLFGENIRHHRPLPDPERIAWPAPVSEREISAVRRPVVTIADLYKSLGKAFSNTASHQTRPDPPPSEMLKIANERLAALNIFESVEMRHESSLSPIGLLRKWRMDIAVDCGRHRYRLSGTQTAYGRGLDLDAARAALAMEIVERYSSFAGVASGAMKGYSRHYPLIRARYSELAAEMIPTLNPNDLSLETAYDDAPIYWITAESTAGPVRVPAQRVFLFFNLDEPKLFSALGSTGLASGGSLAAAKVSALLELIERDAEATAPFDPAQCFEVEANEDSRLASLLRTYRDAGIWINFQDITPAIGVPCCKCFVRNRAGEVIKGTGAHLDARRALLSAMTETPFPFPNGEPSASGMATRIRVPFENLPDYTTGDPETDLKLLESLLAENGYAPIYVDLTRSDLGLPVVRAIVPGMEVVGDFDRFSRVHPRLYVNYIDRFHRSGEAGRP